jgi:hypothetical protein
MSGSSAMCCSTRVRGNSALISGGAFRRSLMRGSRALCRPALRIPLRVAIVMPGHSAVCRQSKNQNDAKNPPATFSCLNLARKLHVCT